MPNLVSSYPRFLFCRDILGFLSFKDSLVKMGQGRVCGQQHPRNPGQRTGKAVDSEILAVVPFFQFLPMYRNGPVCGRGEGVFGRVHREVTERNKRGVFSTGLMALAVLTRAALIPSEK